jgi:transposase-like protein
VDQHGQVIDVLLTARRDARAARRFFTRALGTLKVIPTEAVTDAAPVYPAVLEELVPAAWRPGGDRRACLRPEPAPWTLRTRR